MDVALLNLLEDRSPTPSPPAAGAARRLRDLWLAGVPLERAALAAGFPVAEAQRRLTAAGYRPTPGPDLVDVEPLRALYIDEGLPAAQVADRLGLTETEVRSRLARAGVRRRPKSAAVAGEAVRLYQSGLSVRAVAAELGIHQRDVWRHLDRAGVERRPRTKPAVVLSKRRDRFVAGEVAGASRRRQCSTAWHRRRRR